MTENNLDNTEIVPEDVVSLTFRIQKFEKDGETFHLVGFDGKDKDDMARMLAMTDISQLPLAMMEWGKILLIDELGWVPPEAEPSIVVPKSKLILPD